MEIDCCYCYNKLPKESQISYCNCKGNLLVHKYCLDKWRIVKYIGHMEYDRCEKCNGTYNYSIEDIKKKYKLYADILMIVTALFMGIMIFLNNKVNKLIFNTKLYNFSYYLSIYGSVSLIGILYCMYFDQHMQHKGYSQIFSLVTVLTSALLNHLFCNNYYPMLYPLYLINFIHTMIIFYNMVVEYVTKEVIPILLTIENTVVYLLINL